MRSVFKIFFQVAVFAGLHSLLASRPAKAAFAKTFGARQEQGLYRVLYIAQSAFSLAFLWAAIRRLPDRRFYHMRGPLGYSMRLGQLFGLAYAAYAAATVGLSRITGLASLRAWLNDAPAIPHQPEAQGPAPHLDRPGLNTGGPFRFHRHPLNFAPLLVFWLNPRMTLKLLAYNTAATAYLLLGSIHEEARLVEAYGDDYRRYQASGVSFFWPDLPW